MSDQKKENIYQCPECGLHYRDRELATKCEVFCKEHKACSMEIAPHAIENEPRTNS
jgi:hypothetical protein